MSTVLLQANLKQNVIYFNNQMITLDDEKMTLLYEKLGSFWHNDKDAILLFEYYADGSYLCERKKEVFDYRFRNTLERNYIFAEASLEQAKQAYDVFAAFFEESRILDLQKSREEVKERISDFISVTQINVRNVRNKRLAETDWIMLPDSPVDDSYKNLIIKYRQTLRDITINEEFVNNPLDLSFPITPQEYVDKYPNQEVEYLSTPDQYTYYYMSTLKSKILRLYEWLGLPSLLSVIDEFDEISQFEKIRARVQKIADSIDSEIIVPPIQVVPPKNAQSPEYIETIIQNIESEEYPSFDS